MKRLSIFATLVFAAVPAVAPAQQAAVPQQSTAAPQKTVAQAKPSADRLEPDDRTTPRTDIAPEARAARTEAESEERASVLPYYNNYVNEYRLGPEDVISVEVFDQPRYSKAGIVVPPTGKISYIHIKGGLSVVGKTTQQVEDEITRHYQEYIIDPQVNVTLDKVGSARFSILGDVGSPGVRLMTHRYSLREAIAEAGGVLSTGNKKKVTIVRAQGEGLPPQQIKVDLAAMEKGKAPDTFLAPGDQIIVPGNTFKKIQSYSQILSIFTFAQIFRGGF